MQGTVLSPWQGYNANPYCLLLNCLLSMQAVQGVVEKITSLISSQNIEVFLYTVRTRLDIVLHALNEKVTDDIFEETSIL